jgi:methylated-DNA-[protein]-cysteine S-methyltransferase
MAMSPIPEYAAKVKTPFAVLGIRTDGRAITAIEYLPKSERAAAPADPVAKRAVAELERYLADPRHRFTLPLAPRGTVFQRRVWDAIAAIPVGESRTYGEIARSVRSAPRAVGQACGANPIALVVPCHRVVGSKGALGGFMNAADGDPLAVKRWLLVHEGYRFGA